MKSFFSSIILCGLLAVPGAPPQAAQPGGFAGPRAVVTEYLRRDSKGEFTNPKGRNNLQRLTVWEQMPPGTETVVVRSHRIVSERLGKDRTVIKVHYDSLGSIFDSQEGYVLRRTANSRPIVHFELALTQGVWKIVAPHMPPHVSLSFALMQYAAKDSVCRPPKQCMSQRTLEQLKRMAK